MTEIRKNFKKGIIYNSLSRYSNVAVSIVIGAVLARLLSPEEFGVVAIITVFINFFNLLSSFGISAAIVQNQTLSDEDISSIFLFTFFIGVFSSIVFFLSASFIAEFYNKPILVDLTRLMSLAIFFNTLKIVPNALNMKQLKFREIGIISVSVHILSGVAAIVMAFFGLSYYALIFNSIISSILLFVAFFYLSPIKISHKFNLNSIKKIAKFSTYQFLFQFINYFAGNLDNLLIGKFFNTSALGFYDKAYKLMRMPVQNLTFVITPVLHPILAEFQNDKIIIYNAYYKVVKFLAIIGFPLSIFLFFSSTEIINILYGSQWKESIPVFQFLALAVGIQIVLSSTGSIFQATNRTDLLFLSGLLSTVLVLAGIFYGLLFGKSIEAIGLGILIAFSINVIQAFYLLINKSLKKSFIEFVKVFYFPIIISFFTGIILYIISNLQISNLIISFVIKIITTIITMTIIIYFSKENKYFVKEYLFKTFRK